MGSLLRSTKNACRKGIKVYTWPSSLSFLAEVPSIHLNPSAFISIHSKSTPALSPIKNAFPRNVSSNNDKNLLQDFISNNRYDEVRSILDEWKDSDSKASLLKGFCQLFIKHCYRSKRYGDVDSVCRWMVQNNIMILSKSASLWIKSVQRLHGHPDTVQVIQTLQMYYKKPLERNVLVWLLNHCGDDELFFALTYIRYFSTPIPDRNPGKTIQKKENNREYAKEELQVLKRLISNHHLDQARVLIGILNKSSYISPAYLVVIAKALSLEGSLSPVRNLCKVLVEENVTPEPSVLYWIGKSFIRHNSWGEFEKLLHVSNWVDFSKSKQFQHLKLYRIWINQEADNLTEITYLEGKASTLSPCENSCQLSVPQSSNDIGMSRLKTKSTWDATKWHLILLLLQKFKGKKSPIFFAFLQHFKGANGGILSTFAFNRVLFSLLDQQTEVESLRSMLSGPLGEGPFFSKPSDPIFQRTILPDDWTFGLFLRHYLIFKEYDKADHVFYLFINHTRHRIHLRHFLQHQNQSTLSLLPSQSLSTSQSIKSKQHGVSYRTTFPLYPYIIMAVSYAKRGETVKCFSVLDILNYSHVQGGPATLYQRLIEIFSKQGKLEEAKRLYFRSVEMNVTILPSIKEKLFLGDAINKTLDP